MSERPTIVVTGASGFLGSRLVRVLAARHRVVAIDRQPRSDAGFDDDPNVVWHRIDLADADAVGNTFDRIRGEGGAHALVHLAAYYDFTGEDHPEYRRTNVEAMRLVVESSVDLGLRQFVFASSIAACDFSKPGHPITEETPPHGPHLYAVTKRYGEELLHEYRDRLPSTIIRFGAMFSDWCEYPPLYFFLETWLSERWNARVLGGRGRSSVPFLHVRDGVEFMMRVIEKADDLEPAEILLASTDGAVTHQQLFDRATDYFFGEKRKAFHVPKLLCYPGMWGRDVAGRLLGNRPFERPWMAGYVDKELEVDTSRTRGRLGWSPRERLGILERIPFMIENARTSRMEWYGRNLEALEHHELRPRFRVYLLVRKLESDLERGFAARLESIGEVVGSPEERERTSRVALRALVQRIRTGEKSPFTTYCRALAERQVQRGAGAEDVVAIVRALEGTCLEVLGRDPDAEGLDKELRHSITVTADFGIDQILDVYESTNPA
jgi:nucleoside-diphosphate-sugar epimerase